MMNDADAGANADSDYTNDASVLMCLGSITWSKFDEFSENFQRGVISDPKTFVADFFVNFEGEKQ